MRHPEADLRTRLCKSLSNVIIWALIMTYTCIDVRKFIFKTYLAVFALKLVLEPPRTYSKWPARVMRRQPILTFNVHMVM